MALSLSFGDSNWTYIHVCIPTNVTCAKWSHTLRAVFVWEQESPPRNHRQIYDDTKVLSQQITLMRLNMDYIWLRGGWRWGGGGNLPCAHGRFSKRNLFSYHGEFTPFVQNSHLLGRIHTFCWGWLHGMEVDLYKSWFLDGCPDGYGTILYSFLYTWGSRGIPTFWT